MFEITIKASSLSELGEMLQDAAALHSATAEPLSAPKPAARSRKAATPVEREPTGDTVSPAPSEEQEVDTDDELQRELNEDVEPMPETAKAIVDAGTGQPAAAEVNKKMTMEDVKVAAAKLAQKDTPKLAAILKAYGAAKISEVSKDKLGDFAADVLEALG